MAIVHEERALTPATETIGDTPARLVALAGQRRTLAGYVLVGSAFIACPCHLPITAAILAPLIAGTALGALLAANLGLVMLGLGVYFVGALGVGLRLASRTEASDDCASCKPPRRR